MILVADTSNSDVMTDYPLMAHMFPDNFQCILCKSGFIIVQSSANIAIVRNTSVSAVLL